MFHSRDGFYFKRLSDGSVRVTLGRPILRQGGAEYSTDLAVIQQTLLSPSEWASVVASVSGAGETSDTWQRALKEHCGS